MFGIMGLILRVNLTSGQITQERLETSVVKKFLGGRCLGAKILFEELKPGIDPLGIENKLVFATGPITGAPFPGNARFVVMGKSPLTGGWGEAHAAGFFGPELKFSGFDAIIIEGKATDPVYLWVHDGKAEIRDASHLWGKVIGDVQDIIRKEHGDNSIRIAAIGPGSENLVRFGCIISDLHRAAGRCGLGAVMGSKLLKAAAVRGSYKIKIANKEKLNNFAKDAAKEVMEGKGKTLRLNGTNSGLDSLSASGRLPTYNFRKCSFKDADKITGETVTKVILKKRLTCPSCPVACIRIVESKEKYLVDPKYGGPEYETVAAFGSLCMNNNLLAIAKANELCNKFTIDTMSTGVVIAFAMECFEKGLITKEDSNGIELTWGNHEAIIQLIEKIVKREGIGDILADGVMRAAKKIGKNSDAFALHIKGQELPMHEPRGKKGVGLSYAISNRGACHLQAPHDDDFLDKRNLDPKIGLFPNIAMSTIDTGRDKVYLVKTVEEMYSLFDSLIVCKNTAFPSGISIGTLVGIFNSIMGWNTNAMQLKQIGERAINLCRAFNAREGMTRKDDVLPKRLMEPLSEGSYSGEAIPKHTLDKMLDYYYDMRGWNSKTGLPTKEKLKELELGYVAEELG
ncbi:MAG: aldehyde ferredoxin oxidoreductase family protein [Candidatus Bathyarchaeota archaeon]|nr:aldehyde ferredoxin oxidoreductase family protein [Candidatus Bathyarchaeota archaeon]